MDPQAVIVIGASEGGVSALRAVLAALPEDLPAAVLVVLHIGAHESELPTIFNRDPGLRASHARNGEPLCANRVYVAPPDHHMIVSDGAIRLTKGPRENFARPSIDPLFRSVAEEYGPAAIGVILTGGLSDGVAGLYEIAQRGGVTIVQDPAEATNPSMPASALRYVAVDHCAPLAAIPRLLERAVAARAIVVPLIRTASEGLERPMTAEFTLDRPVAVTCPDCGGALKQDHLGALTQYRCHIGHIYSAPAMLAGQFRALEQSVEMAMRSLNERAEMCRQMGAAEPDQTVSIQWRQAMHEAHAQTEPLRKLLDHAWMHPSPSLVRNLGAGAGKGNRTPVTSLED